MNRKKKILILGACTIGMAATACIVATSIIVTKKDKKSIDKSNKEATLNKSTKSRVINHAAIEETKPLVKEVSKNKDGTVDLDTNIKIDKKVTLLKNFSKQLEKSFNNSRELIIENNNISKTDVREVNKINDNIKAIDLKRIELNKNNKTIKEFNIEFVNNLILLKQENVLMANLIFETNKEKGNEKEEKYKKLIDVFSGRIKEKNKKLSELLTKLETIKKDKETSKIIIEYWVKSINKLIQNNNDINELNNQFNNFVQTRVIDEHMDLINNFINSNNELLSISLTETKYLFHKLLEEETQLKKKKELLSFQKDSINIQKSLNDYQNYHLYNELENLNKINLLINKEFDSEESAKFFEIKFLEFYKKQLIVKTMLINKKATYSKHLTVIKNEDEIIINEKINSLLKYIEDNNGKIEKDRLKIEEFLIKSEEKYSDILIYLNTKMVRVSDKSLYINELHEQINVIENNSLNIMFNFNSKSNEKVDKLVSINNLKKEALLLQSDIESQDATIKGMYVSMDFEDRPGLQDLIDRMVEDLKEDIKLLDVKNKNIQAAEQGLSAYILVDKDFQNKIDENDKQSAELKSKYFAYMDIMEYNNLFLNQLTNIEIKISDKMLEDFNQETLQDISIYKEQIENELKIIFRKELANTNGSTLEDFLNYKKRLDEKIYKYRSDYEKLENEKRKINEFNRDKNLLYDDLINQIQELNKIISKQKNMIKTFKEKLEEKVNFILNEKDKNIVPSDSYGINLRNFDNSKFSRETKEQVKEIMELFNTIFKNFEF
ncbi:hypothetical protein [Mycoplasma crocodyli]|uniref:Putative lipoprotein n=1 Tax=Mycoplasma crocodyli (strain ATCC 51981 / MP145) TaxID=512564 RepID=D5E5E9_MYCCM|nr:hypothetical protein [Mycoplasma crocodyli]ADE19428.1 putative lipoprotein [Mycoplasma crocodyli MP145]